MARLCAKVHAAHRRHLASAVGTAAGAGACDRPRNAGTGSDGSSVKSGLAEESSTCVWQAASSWPDRAHSQHPAVHIMACVMKQCWVKLAGVSALPRKWAPPSMPASLTFKFEQVEYDIKCEYTSILLPQLIQPVAADPLVVLKSLDHRVGE